MVQMRKLNPERESGSARSPRGVVAEPKPELTPLNFLGGGMVEEGWLGWGHLVNECHLPPGSNLSEAAPET